MVNSQVSLRSQTLPCPALYVIVPHASGVRTLQLMGIWIVTSTAGGGGGGAFAPVAQMQWK